MNLERWVHRLWTDLVCFCWSNSARAWQQGHSEEKIPLPASLIFNASLTWEIKPRFLSLMFFSINLVMKVKHWVMFFHVCLQSWSGTKRGWGTLAHNMESLSKESNNKRLQGFIVPKHTDYYYYCILTASLTTYQLNCVAISDLWAYWQHLWTID